MKITPIHIYFSDTDRNYILTEIDNAIKSGYISQGKHVRSFEKKFAEYTNARYAVALNSGSAAIEIAMQIKNVAGKTVIVQANANFATAVAAIRMGAKVKLVDINLDTLSPGVDEFEAAWSPDVVGVILVHMGGIIPKDIIEIKEWCERRNIWLFEDCAHAHGSRYEGIHVGHFGFAGGFSFFVTKVITSCEGGMLITDDEEVTNMARLYRNLGKPELWSNYHVLKGTNARMGEFNALIGNVQLRHLDEFVKDRQRVADKYTDLLMHCTDIEKIILPADVSSWYKYVIILPHDCNKKILKEQLKKSDIELAGEIYERPLHKQPALIKRYRNCKFPISEYYCNKHVCLPIYFGMTNKEIAYVVSNLKNVLQKCRTGK